MTLTPLEFDRRLASPAEAEAWFRAIGQKRVSVRGFHTSDSARIERLIEAIDPSRENRVSFEGGMLTSEAWDALHALAVGQFNYLDIRTASANLRIWPKRRTWVQSSHDLSSAARALDLPLTPGANTVGDVEVTITESSGYTLGVETRSVPSALTIFRALSGPGIERGHLDGISADAKPHALHFLSVASTRVHVVLELGVSVARDLTEHYAGETLDWQADGLQVDFPDGRIHGFLKPPKDGARHRARWHARVAKGLRRAELVVD